MYSEGDKQRARAWQAKADIDDHRTDISGSSCYSACSDEPRAWAVSYEVFSWIANAKSKRLGIEELRLVAARNEMQFSSRAAQAL